MNDIEKLKYTYEYIFSDKTAAQVLAETKKSVEANRQPDLLFESAQPSKRKTKAGFSVHVLCNCGSPDLSVNEGIVSCNECGHAEAVNG